MVYVHIAFRFLFYGPTVNVFLPPTKKFAETSPRPSHGDNVVGNKPIMCNKCKDTGFDGQHVLWLKSFYMFGVVGDAELNIGLANIVYYPLTLFPAR